jgi:hypothetical protein
MRVFDNDEEAYTQWVRTDNNRNCPVANITRRRRGETEPRDITMHRAWCGHMRSEQISNYTTHDYYKVGFDDEEDLDAWEMRTQINNWHNCY